MGAGKCLDKQLEQEAGQASHYMLLGLPAKAGFLFSASFPCEDIVSKEEQ